MSSDDKSSPEQSRAYGQDSTNTFKNTGASNRSSPLYQTYVEKTAGDVEKETKTGSVDRAGHETKEECIYTANVNGLQVSAFHVTYPVLEGANIDDQANPVVMLGSTPNAVEREMWEIRGQISSAVDTFISKIGIQKLVVDKVQEQHKHLLPMFSNINHKIALLHLGNVDLKPTLPVNISIQSLVAIACVRWVFHLGQTAQQNHTSTVTSQAGVNTEDDQKSLNPRLQALDSDNEAQAAQAAEWARVLNCVICSVCDMPDQALNNGGVPHAMALENELFAVLRHALALTIVLDRSKATHRFFMPRTGETFAEGSMVLADERQLATGRVEVCLFPGMISYIFHLQQHLMMARAVVY